MEEEVWKGNGQMRGVPSGWLRKGSFMRNILLVFGILTLSSTKDF